MSKNQPAKVTKLQHREKAPTKSIGDILLADPHVVRIHYSSYSESMLPQIDYSLWRAKKRAEKEIKALQDYLCMPYIEDDFGADHSARRRWESTQEKRVWGYLDKNPIGANNYAMVILTVNGLNYGYKGTNPEEFERLRNALFADYPSNYNEKSITVKIEFAEKIKKRVYELLQFLSEQKPVVSR